MEDLHKNLLKALKNQFGEVDGQKMYDYHLYTERHFKGGENVIHTTFEGDAFTDAEVEEINKEFLKHSYQFSYVDESQIIKAHFDYHEIIATLHLKFTLVDVLINAVIYPLVWETIKMVVGRMAKRREELKRETKKGDVEKDTICIMMNISPDVTVSFFVG